MWLSSFLPYSIYSFFSSLSPSISLSLCSSAILGRALGGISSGEDMPLSALTVPLGSSPFPNPGMEDPWRVSARAATGSMRNAGSDEKEDWLETGNSYPRRKTEVRRRWKEPSNDKRKLTSSFCPPRRLPLPPASCPPNFQWENYARNLQPGISTVSARRAL